MKPQYILLSLCLVLAGCSYLDLEPEKKGTLQEVFEDRSLRREVPVRWLRLPARLERLQRRAAGCGAPGTKWPSRPSGAPTGIGPKPPTRDRSRPQSRSTTTGRTTKARNSPHAAPPTTSTEASASATPSSTWWTGFPTPATAKRRGGKPRRDSWSPISTTRSCGSTVPSASSRESSRTTLRRRSTTRPGVPTTNA